MSLTFSGIAIGCNRKTPEQLGRVIREDVWADCFIEFYKKADKAEHEASIGLVDGWFYSLELTRVNLFVRLTPKEGRLSLEKVRAYERQHRLAEDPFLMFVPKGASDRGIKRQITDNLLKGRPWDYGLNL